MIVSKFKHNRYNNIKPDIALCFFLIIILSGNALIHFQNNNEKFAVGLYNFQDFLMPILKYKTTLNKRNAFGMSK